MMLGLPIPERGFITSYQRNVCAIMLGISLSAQVGYVDQ